MESLADDDLPCPFLIHVFHRNGTYPSLEDFSARTLPPHISIHATKETRLDELACLIAAENASLLPSPAIGTRLAFQLVFPDTRGQNPARPNNPYLQQPRYAARDIGSVVIGGDGPGTADGDFADEEDEASERARQERLREDSKTLGQVRFGVGDYIGCAILPPLPSGIVAPVSMARRERIPGINDVFGSRGRGGSSRGGGFNRSYKEDWGGPGGQNHDFQVPSGEWRRGERLPSPPVRQRGRGRR